MRRSLLSLILRITSRDRVRRYPVAPVILDVKKEEKKKKGRKGGKEGTNTRGKGKGYSREFVIAARIIHNRYGDAIRISISSKIGNGFSPSERECNFIPTRGGGYVTRKIDRAGDVVRK